VCRPANPTKTCHPERSHRIRKANPMAESRDLLFLYTATNVGASAVGRGTRNNLSSRAQSRGPCVPQSHPSQAAGCPIFPRSVRKGGNRESRPAHAVILRKRSRAHATPNEGSLHQAPPISAGASVPARADPKQSIIPSAAEGPCISQSHPSQVTGCPIFPRPMRKGGKRESRQGRASHRHSAHENPARPVFRVFELSAIVFLIQE
jgi:hypothetical protein